MLSSLLCQPRPDAMPLNRPSTKRHLPECLWCKYLLGPLAIAALIAAVAAPSADLPQAAAAEASQPAEKTKTPAPAAATTDPDLKDRLQRLEDRERAIYSMEIERQRKGIDWWLSFLAVVATVIAFGGGFIPYLIGRRDKEELQRMLDDAKQALERMNKNVATSDDLLKQHSQLLASGTVQQGNSPEALQNNRELEAAAKQVAENKDASFTDRLRAKAVEAQLAGDYIQSAAYWQAMTAEDPKDARAWFGWGSALAGEAQAMAASDVAAARRLWPAAGGKYALALQIRPEMHGAANNWGIALLQEFQACKKQGLDEPALLTLAEEKLRHAETIKPGAGAYNLACVHALRQQPDQAVSWLRICQQHGALPPEAHICNDPDFDPIRHSPEFRSWWRETFGDVPLEREGSAGEGEA